MTQELNGQVQLDVLQRPQHGVIECVRDGTFIGVHQLTIGEVTAGSCQYRLSDVNTTVRRDYLTVRAWIGLAQVPEVALNITIVPKPYLELLSVQNLFVQQGSREALSSRNILVNGSSDVSLSQVFVVITQQVGAGQLQLETYRTTILVGSRCRNSTHRKLCIQKKPDKGW